jgi:hypothetical protein
LPNREGQFKSKDVKLKGKQSSGSLSCEFWSKDKKKKLKFHASDILSVGKGTATPMSLPPGTSPSTVLYLKLSDKPELNLAFESEGKRDQLVVGFQQLVEQWSGLKGGE